MIIAVVGNLLFNKGFGYAAFCYMEQFLEVFCFSRKEYCGEIRAAYTGDFADLGQMMVIEF